LRDAFTLDDRHARCFAAGTVSRKILDRHRHEIELMRRNDGDVALRTTRRGDESFT
jgi:hypothetical protein